MTDSDIIRLFFHRDEQAISETAARYGKYCMTIARDILGSEQDAEECVSDVYLKAWNSIPPESPTSLKAYVAVLTRRLAINRYHENRAQRRNRELEVAFEELEDCIPAPEEAASELPELIGVCHRIYVMSGGEITGEVTAADTTQEEIMTLAAKNV